MNLLLPWRAWLQALIAGIEARMGKLGPVEERLHRLLKEEHGWVSTVRLRALHESRHGFLSSGTLYYTLEKLEYHLLASHDYRDRQTDAPPTRRARYYRGTGAWDD